MGADEYLTPAELPLYPQLTAFATRRYGAGATAKDAIIGFVNWVDRIVRNHHKTLRAWHDELAPGTVLRARADIVVDWWTNISPLSDPRPPRPMQLLAAGHRIANDGWFPTYFTGDVGPVQGMPDMRKAYESWSVNQFCGPTIADAFIEPCYVVASTERRNLGSSINVWDDRDLSLRQISAGLSESARARAEDLELASAEPCGHATFRTRSSWRPGVGRCALRSRPVGGRRADNSDRAGRQHRPSSPVAHRENLVEGIRRHSINTSGSGTAPVSVLTPM